MKSDKPVAPEFPIATATAREILAMFYPRHSLHSIILVEDEMSLMDITCSCGQILVITEKDAAAEKLDYRKIQARFDKLGKYDKLDKIHPTTVPKKKL